MFKAMYCAEHFKQFSGQGTSAAAGKCQSGGCPQAVFRDGLCVDHFRLTGKKVAIVTDEKITDQIIKKFRELTAKKYVDQAKWYLNGFWTYGADEQAEEVWTITHKFQELDVKKKEGRELDPVLSAHYLQGLGKPMTALELKEALRRIDVDANGMMALLEYLLYKYGRSVVKMVQLPQGGMDEEGKRKLEEAEAKCAALQKALEDLSRQLEIQKQDEIKAKQAEVAAKAAAIALAQAEQEARAADAELQKQVDDLKRKVTGLEAKISNPSTGSVARGQAVQELAALKGADPLPLRKAKITQEAAVRRVEAERKQAELNKKLAEEARAAAEEQTRKVEAAIVETNRKAKEADEYLEELKRAPNQPHGAIWWLQREVAEAKKYMPRSRQ